MARIERIEITPEELRADFEAALVNAETQEDGYTAKELAHILNCGLEKARNNMTILILAGLWEAVTIMRVSPLRPGVLAPVCGYRQLQSRD